MVLIIIVTGVYKPTYNWGAHIVCICLVIKHPALNQSTKSIVTLSEIPIDIKRKAGCLVILFGVSRWIEWWDAIAYDPATIQMLLSPEFIPDWDVSCFFCTCKSPLKFKSNRADLFYSQRFWMLREGRSKHWVPSWGISFWLMSHTEA